MLGLPEPLSGSALYPVADGPQPLCHCRQINTVNKLTAPHPPPLLEVHAHSIHIKSFFNFHYPYRDITIVMAGVIPFCFGFLFRE